MGIQEVLNQIKQEFETVVQSGQFNGATYQNGLEAKQALIRSQKLINLLHNFIKSDLISHGVNANKIYPKLGESKPEIKLQGFLKSKNQDISICPTQIIDNSDYPFEKILSINVRSQFSSLQKNIDTLYERTFAEALNLHLKNPSQCLGEVYLIPVYEYCDQAMIQNTIRFKNKSKIERYIEMFLAISGRNELNNDYKYERVALLIVDFNQSNPKLYSSLASLKNDNLVSPNFNLDFDAISLNHFSEDLLNTYQQRFDLNLIR